VAKAGNNITLYLNTHFRPGVGSGDPTTNPAGVPGFIGPQNVYMTTTTSTVGSVQLVGTWTPFPAPHSTAVPAAVAPSSVATDGTVAVQISDSNGFNYMPYAELTIGASATDSNACRIRYDRGSGAGNHVLSLYAGDFTAIGPIGTAPVGSAGVQVQNSSTCVVDIGNSYVVSEAGTGDVLHVKVGFKTSGTFNTYLTAFDRAGASGTGVGAIYVAPNNFSLSPVSAFSVQQSGAAAAFVVGATPSGTFSGLVNLTYSAPSGVTLTFTSTSLNLQGNAASTAVQVIAYASATVGTGNISITGTSGALTYLLNVPVTVAPATPPPPPPPVSGFSLWPVTPVVAQQSGAAASFTLNVPTTGSFSGPVSFSYTAPAGVTLAFRPNTITVPAATSTNVQVIASGTAAVAAGNITVTAVSGTLSYPLSVALTVTAAANTVTTTVAPPASPTPTFVISGEQSQTLNVSSYTSVATFVVTVTGVNGFAQPVTVSVDANETSNYISASVNSSNSATVTPGQSVSVTVQGLGLMVSNLYCTGVVATGGGMQVFGAPLCIRVTGAASSFSFSVPVPPAGIAVPSGGTTTIYGALSTFGSTPTPQFSQSAVCPASVFPCNPNASFGPVSSGGVSITFSSGSLPVDTVYSHYISDSEGGSTPCPIRVVSPNPGGQGPSVVPANTYYQGATPISLSTSNDGSVGSADYTLQCGGAACSTALLGSCTLPQAAGSHIALYTTVTSEVFGSSFNFNVSTVADNQAFAGIYAINCQYGAYSLGAESLAAYDATPVITSVSPSTVSAGSTITITVTGYNFGNNPVLTVGTATQALSGIGISGLVQISGVFQIPSAAAGTSIPVFVASTGEVGRPFFANPQAAGSSPSRSAAFYVTVTGGNPNLTLQVQSNGSALQPGACAYIAPTTPAYPYGPIMPQISATVVAGDGSAISGNATWQLITTFNLLTEPGVTLDPNNTISTPSSPVQFPANQTWFVPFPMFGLNVFGGRSEIDWSYDGQRQTPFVFKICGQNPSPSVLGTYFSGAQSSAGNTYWFANNISIHETVEQQFYVGDTKSNCSLSTDSAKPGNSGLPLCGYPAGYGLMQLDPSTSSQAWNWQQNIVGGLNLLDAKATNGGNGSGYIFWSRQVAQWQQYNAMPQNSGNPIPPPSDDVFPDPSDTNQFPSCRFSLLANAPSGDRQGAYAPPTYWYGDPVLMKNYAGGTPNYIYWNSPSGNSTSAAWGKSRVTLLKIPGNFQKHNTPYEFCSCSTVQSCQHQTPGGLWYLQNQ
jgi:hypothetical protein